MLGKVFEDLKRIKGAVGNNRGRTTIVFNAFKKEWWSVHEYLRVGARKGRKAGALRWEIVSDVEKTAGFQWMGMCSTLQSRYESQRIVFGVRSGRFFRPVENGFEENCTCIVQTLRGITFTHCVGLAFAGRRGWRHGIGALIQILNQIREAVHSPISVPQNCSDASELV